MSSTLLTILAQVTETAEHGGHDEVDKTPYYVIGTLLAVAAVVVSAAGIKGHERWPASEGAKKGVMGVFTLLVIATMVSSILTS